MKYLFLLLTLVSCTIRPSYVKQIKYQKTNYEVTQCKVCKEPSYFVKLNINVTDIDLPKYQNTFGIKRLNGMGDSTISLIMLPGYDPEAAVVAITNRIEQDYKRINQK